MLKTKVEIYLTATTTSGATGSPIQGTISGSPPAPTRKSYGEMASSNYGLMSSDNPPSTRDKRNPRTLRKDSQSQSQVLCV